MGSTVIYGDIRVTTMRGCRALALLLVIVFTAPFIPYVGHENSITNHREQRHLTSSNLPYNSTALEIVAESIDIQQLSPNLAASGFNLIPIQYYFADSLVPDFGFVIAMDMEGSIHSGLYRDGYGYKQPTWINSTTVALVVDDEPDSITLWNIMTNGTEVLPIPSGINDIAYNPNTESFLVIESTDLGLFSHEGTDYTIIGNDVVEYDLQGNETWRWEGDLTFPFNETEYLLREENVEGEPTEIDWMHANSITWDIEENMVYLAVRNLDCFVKINYTSASSEWILGGYKNQFNFTSISGARIEQIFYHPDSCKKVGPDLFVCLDTDYYNLTSGDPLMGESRYIEFLLDEGEGMAQIVRSWSTSNFVRDGDIDRIPRENTLLTLNREESPILFEINPNDREAWRVEFHSEGYLISIDSIDRFYGMPLVFLGEVPETSVLGATLHIDLRIWDNIRREHFTSGHIEVREEGTIIETTTLPFERYWMETNEIIHISGLTLGWHNLSITVRNSDGLEGIRFVQIVVEHNTLVYANYTAIILIVLIIVMFAWKKQK